MRGEGRHEITVDERSRGRDSPPSKLTIQVQGARSGCFAWLLPAGDVAHVGRAVGDALVAVDAGLLAGEQEALMRDGRPRRLLGDVHRLRAVTVAALKRARGAGV